MSRTSQERDELQEIIDAFVEITEAGYSVNAGFCETC